jgi:F0F1-type ATP synthase delta subunit
VLAENGRLADVELIASKFEELMMASRGEVKAVVTSAEVRTQNQPYRDCGKDGDHEAADAQ